MWHSSTDLHVLVDGVIFRNQSHGGISRIFREILPRVAELDPDLHIDLLMSGRARQPVPTHSRIQVHSLPRPERFLRPGRLWRPALPLASRAMISLCVRPDRKAIWHSTYYTLPDKQSRSTVVTIYDMIYERFPQFFNDDASHALRERKRRCTLDADIVICISHSTSQDVQHYYKIDPGRIRVIPPACSSLFSASRKAVPARSTCPFLIYVGSRAAYKNFASLLRGFRSWPRCTRTQLLVVGREWTDAERRLIDELGLRDQVVLAGTVSDEDLCTLYNQALAFVYPSYYEGFGIPLLEAMACGCPIVASRIPSTQEVAGDYPFYFDPDDLDGLVDALDAAADQGRSASRVDLGKRQIGAYSWDRTAIETLQVYRDIAG